MSYQGGPPPPYPTNTGQGGSYQYGQPQFPVTPQPYQNPVPDAATRENLGKTLWGNGIVQLGLGVFMLLPLGIVTHAVGGSLATPWILSCYMIVIGAAAIFFSWQEQRKPPVSTLSYPPVSPPAPGQLQSSGPELLTVARVYVSLTLIAIGLGVSSFIHGASFTASLFYDSTWYTLGPVSLAIGIYLGGVNAFLVYRLYTAIKAATPVGRGGFFILCCI